MFLAWCADQAGLIPVVGDHAWTVGHAEWFKARGQWGHKPKKGALVFFNWGGTRNIRAIDHVGIVAAVRGGTIDSCDPSRVMSGHEPGPAQGRRRDVAIPPG